MSPDRETAATKQAKATDRSPVRRRRFLALAGSAGAVALAGCSGDGGSDDTDGSGGGNGDATVSDGDGESATDSQAVGTFRLLVSDQPVAIDEFDSLEVSFDRARVFRSGEDENDESTDEETQIGTTTATATGTPADNETTATATATVTPTETAEDDADGGDEEEDEDREAEGEDGEGGEDAGGFSVIDLDGATVDLTQVLGKKALGVFEGGLPAGRYTKIELYAANVDGIVDGESADVKIPSGKLQIVKPFEIEAESTVSFVFDINVVKKGNGGYNLLPVISESGVAGEDVEVEEVGDGKGDDQDDDEADGDDTETEEVETDGDDTGGADDNETGGRPEDGTATATPTDA